MLLDLNVVNLGVECWNVLPVGTIFVSMCFE